MSKRYMTRPEFNAIIAGLRSIQEAPHSKREQLSILTDGNVDAIDDEGIDDLIEALNFDEIQLEIKED